MVQTSKQKNTCNNPRSSGHLLVKWHALPTSFACEKVWTKTWHSAPMRRGKCWLRCANLRNLRSCMLQASFVPEKPHFLRCLPFLSFAVAKQGSLYITNPKKALKGSILPNSPCYCIVWSPKKFGNFNDPCQTKLIQRVSRVCRQWSGWTHSAWCDGRHSEDLEGSEK